MDEKKYLKIIDSSGKEIAYEIICAFKMMKTNKNYIVYTDNTTNEDGSINIFAAIYYPKDDSKLDPIESEEEWKEIELKLKSMKEK